MPPTISAPMDEVLAAQGVTGATLSAAESVALDEQGYLVVPGALDEHSLESLRREFERAATDEMEAAGAPDGSATGTRHVGDLIGRGPIFLPLYAHPKLLAAAAHILGRPFRVGALDGRDPRPGFGQQGLHSDWMPRAPGDPYEVVSSIWLLDAFTLENGATRLVPGTHRLTGMVPRTLAAPESRHPDEVVIVAPAGSALILNGHVWHGGTRNRSRGPRRVVRCGCGPRTPQPYGEPRDVDAAGFSPAVRYLLDL